MKLATRGLVCDVYTNDDFPDVLLFNRTDRYSLDKCIFPAEIPYKGFVTNQMSLRWKQLLEEAQIVSSNIISTKAKDLIRYGFDSEINIGSASIVKKCIPIPLECIVRGYYVPESPSWSTYLENGTFHGIELPAGLKESERLPKPIFTPSTKSKLGKPDLNISFEKCVEILTGFIIKTFTLTDGAEPEKLAYQLADTIKTISLRAYAFAHEYALKKRIILADAMLEFGLLIDPKTGNQDIILINDAFSPDTSRYWELDSYQIGKSQAPIARQYLQNYLYRSHKWCYLKTPPNIDPFIVHRTSELYIEIFQRIFDVDVKELTCDATWEWKKAVEKHKDYKLREMTKIELEHYFNT
jgi:phosphoribosylaminoimidazole-succinocarboxamide synthase